MGLKILGGMAKGHTIHIPKTGSFRPTQVRLKRRLFDYRQNWDGIIFVDLCAGSGSMGIEAWSREAKSTILVEKNKQNVSLLKKNIQQLSEKYDDELKERSIKVVGRSVTKWIEEELESLLQAEEEVVLYFDPPYNDIKLYQQVFHKVKNYLDSESFEFWIESDRVKGIKLEELVKLGGEPQKTFEQGTSFLVLY